MTAITMSPPETSRDRYNSLDGLRAYAAVGIVAMHVLANMSTPPSCGYITSTLIPWFTDFTLLFMLVSGFSLSCGYFNRIANGEITPSLFYSKRYARILPFFAIMCILDVVVSPGLRQLYELFADLTLCFGLLPDVEISVIGVGWFIGVVFVYYMLFPFIVFLQQTPQRALATLFLSIVMVMVVVFYSESADKFGRTNIVYCLPLFLSGGIVYLFRHAIKNYIQRHKLLSATLLVIVTACFLYSMDYLIINEFTRLISELILFVCWLCVAIGADWKLLSNRIASYLGEISLEIYLCHMLFFRVLEMAGINRYIENSITLYLVTFAGVMLLSVIFSHLIKYHFLPLLLKKR